MRRTTPLFFLLSACGHVDVVPPMDMGSIDASVDAPDTGPPDMRVPTPFVLHATSATGTVTITTDPLTLTVTRPDGTTIVASPNSGAFAFGPDPSGDLHFHDPGAGHVYSPLDFGLMKIDDTHGVIADARGRRATVVLDAPAAGVFHVTMTKDPSVLDVALSRIALHSDDGVYDGLGERHEGNPRGHVVPMQFTLGGTDSGLNEHHVPVPFLVSSRGYGMFVQTRESGAFDVQHADTSQVSATFEGGVLDVWFFVDPDPNEVVALYTRHAGLPRLPPRWAFAPQQWRNEWTDSAQLQGDMDAMRSMHLPVTCMWIDNPWQVSYNDMTFDTTRFADPPALLAEMRSKGFVPLLWSTPYLDSTGPNPAHDLFLMAQTNGWLVRAGTSTFLAPSPGATGGLVDFTSTDATNFWQGRIETLVNMGVRAFKLDYGEDVIPNIGTARLGLAFSDGTSERETHGLFNILYHTPYRQALDARAGVDGGFLLVRASAWGGETTADVIWPGDLENDFSVGDDTHVGGLSSAISSLVSLSASGFPNFASDTGGFRGGMPTREALLRWAEHTTFTPIQQLGGAGDSHNPWLYDAAAGGIWASLSRAHMDLVPYLRLLAIRASTTGYPAVSAVARAYPNDAHAGDDPYSYLLGPDIFVAPVWLAGATTRTTHLPAGTWVHYFTGAVYTGGDTAVTVDVPIGTPAVFVRQGALIPMLPPDVETLVSVSDPTGPVDEGDRPYLRAWIIPAGIRDVITEEGMTIHVDHHAASLNVMTSSTTGGLHDLRAKIDLANANPPITTVTTVTSGGTPVTASASAAVVQAGCAGTCWFQEGTTLWLSVGATTATTVVVN